MVTMFGAVVFLASLGYLTFTYGVTFGRPTPGPVAPLDALLDGLLLAAFCLHHSAFARLPVRRWMASRVGADLERSVYVTVASLLLIAVCALWRPLPGVLWTIPAPMSWALPVVQGLGVLLVLVAARQVDGLILAGLRPARPPADRAGAVFTRQGPYGWVRHPIYLGWCLVVIGATPMTASRALFAGLSLVYIVVAIPLEERTLRAIAPEAYAAYAREVRWLLLPGVY